jgi:hypothetical protein
LPAFAAKRSDSRYQWYVKGSGEQAWELDAMTTNPLRTRVEDASKSYIEWPIWERCQPTEAATKDTIRNFVPMISRQAVK